MNTRQMQDQIDAEHTQEVYVVVEPILLRSDLVAKKIVLRPGAAIVFGRGFRVIGHIEGTVGVETDGELVVIHGPPKD